MLPLRAASVVFKDTQPSSMLRVTDRVIALKWELKRRKLRNDWNRVNQEITVLDQLASYLTDLYQTRRFFVTLFNDTASI
jgi:hypothetical protein